MPDNNPETKDDVQSKMEKFEEMQKYLPFLDSMIEKIKDKKPAALEAQLGKFQQLKTFLVEKNTKKHTMDFLIKAEDIIKKLMVKLDYKDGVVPAIDKSLPSNQQNMRNNPADSDGPPPLIDKSGPGRFGGGSSKASSTSSKAPDAHTSSKAENPGIVDLIMRKLKLGASQGGNKSTDSSSSPKSQPPLTEILNSIAKPIEKKNDSSESDLDKDLDGFDLMSESKNAPKPQSKPDLLASSRQKLMKSVQKRVPPPEPEHNVVNKSYEDSRSRSDREKLNFNEFDIDSMRDSDIERDRTRKSAQQDLGKNYSSSSHPSHRHSDYKKNPEPREKSPSAECKNKQKLRDRLSADITEVHKVGKSVGGSLRCLKDTKKNSGADEDDLFKPDIPTSSNVHKVNPSSSSTSGSSVHADWQKKDKKGIDPTKEFHIEKRLSYLDYLKKNKTDKSANKPEEKGKSSEIDDLNDEELKKFVKENMSTLPHLSTLEPKKLRQIVKATLDGKSISNESTPEYDAVSDQEFDDFLERNNDKNRSKSKDNSKNHPYASVIMSNVGKDGIAKHSKLVQEKKKSSSNLVELDMIGDKTHDDMEVEDEDDYAVRLIEDLPPPLIEKRKKGILDLPMPPLVPAVEDIPDIPFLSQKEPPRPVPPPRPFGAPEMPNDLRNPWKPPLLPTPNFPPNQFPHMPTNEIRSDILRPGLRPSYPEGNRIPTVESIRRDVNAPFNPNFPGSGFNDPRFQVNLRQIEQRPMQPSYNYPPHDNRYQQNFDPKHSRDHRNISRPNDLNNPNVAIVRPSARPPPSNYAEYKQMKFHDKDHHHQQQQQHSPVESNKPEFEKNPEPILKDPRTSRNEPVKDPRLADRNFRSDSLKDPRYAEKSSGSPVYSKSFAEEKQTSKPTHPNVPNRPYDNTRRPEDPRQRRYPEDPKNRDNYRDRQQSYQTERNEDQNQRRRSSETRLSSDTEEFISPLDKLYQGEDKPKTGRGYGLQNFKIPKKVRDPPLQPKEAPKPVRNDKADSDSVVPPRLSGNKPKRGPLHFEDETDSDSSRRTDESFSDKCTTSKDPPTDQSLLDSSAEKPKDSSEDKPKAKPPAANTAQKETKSNVPKTSAKEKPKKTVSKPINTPKSNNRRKKANADSSQTEAKSKSTEKVEKKKTEISKSKGKPKLQRSINSSDSVPLSSLIESDESISDINAETEPAPEPEKAPQPEPVKASEPQPKPQSEPVSESSQSEPGPSGEGQTKPENNSEVSNKSEVNNEKPEDEVQILDKIINSCLQAGEGKSLLKKAKLFKLLFADSSDSMSKKKWKKLSKILSNSSPSSSASSSSSSSSSSTSSSSSSEASDDENESEKKKKRKKKKKKKSKEEKAAKKLSKKKKKKMKKRKILSDSSSSSGESGDEKDKKEETPTVDVKKEKKDDSPIKDGIKDVGDTIQPVKTEKESADATVTNVAETQPVADARTEAEPEVEAEPEASGAQVKKRPGVKRVIKKRKKPLSEAHKFQKRRQYAKEKRMKQQSQKAQQSGDKPKIKKKRKATELDKLQEDIRNMFICDGVVTATGRRTCSLLKKHGGNIDDLDMAKVLEEENRKIVTRASRKENQENNSDDDRSRSQSEETEASRDRSVSGSRNTSPEDEAKKSGRKTRGEKLPLVVLQKVNLDKFGYAYKIADNPNSLKRPHGRNVAKRGGKIPTPVPRRIIKEERIDNISRVYLNRNVRKIMRLKDSTSKKVFAAKKLVDIVAKLSDKPQETPQKPSPSKFTVEKLKVTRRKKAVSHRGEKINQSGSKDAKVDELKKNLSSYAFDKKRSANGEYPCLLCSNKSKSITAHYKTSHPESEVLISRLSKGEAEKAIADSNENSYNVSGLDQASTLDAIKRRVKSKLGERGFSCRMCNSGEFSTADMFFAHVSTHTGEYRYKCPAEKCNTVLPSYESIKAHISQKHSSAKLILLNKVIELFPMPTEYDNLYGYLCSKCYFVQTMRRNVEMHVAVFHTSEDDVEIIKIDMSSKTEPEPAVKEPEKRTRKPRSKPRSKVVESPLEDISDNIELEGPRRITRSRPAEEKQLKPQVETSSPVINPERKKRKRKTEIDKLLEDQKNSSSSESEESSDEMVPDVSEANSADIESDTGSKNSEKEFLTETVNEFIKKKVQPKLKTSAENQTVERMDVDENREDDDGSIFQTTESSQDFFEEFPVRTEPKEKAEKKKEVPKTYRVLKGPAGSVQLCREVKVGPLEAKTLVNNEIRYECFVKGCIFPAFDYDAFEKHITLIHSKSKWDGVCQTCGINVEPESASGVRAFKLSSALEHLRNCHEDVKEIEPVIEKEKPDIKPKIILKAEKMTEDAEKEKKPEVDAETVNAKVNDEDKKPDVAPFPVKPLLRVRNLFGDRLSKPKVDPSRGEDGPPPLIDKPPLEDIVVQDLEAETDSEPLFTIENVVSLDPEEEKKSENMGTPSPIIPPPPLQQAIRKNTHTILKSVGGKQILLRPSPSPQITIRPGNPITIAPKPNPVAIPIKVLPSSSPVMFAQLPNAGNIRIIASSQPVMIAQGQPLNVTAKIVPIVNPTASNFQPKISSETQTSSILKDNPLLTQTVMGNKPSFEALRCAQPSSSPIQIRSPNRIVAVNTPSSSPQLSVSPSLSDSNNDDSGSFRRPQSNSLGGKNVKDTKIYQEMLTKTKLCHLFKCMAVECSFTCSEEDVFTKHIDLHEVQQRMKNQRKNIKSKKVQNWQQCAYCSEVIVQSGAALSQHILSEHGHCLYQCAYCFYRAVSQTYAELHQNFNHSAILKQRPRLILKCKQIPNLPSSKANAEKQTRRQSVRPYHCVQCGSKFFITQEFMDHLAKEHQSVTAYTCHICKNLCFKPDRLISHYKMHSYSMFQCAYCLHGTETKKEMLFHLCNCHFSQPAYMYVRALAQGQKGNHLDALEVVSYENDTPNSEYNIVEADVEENEGADASSQKSAASLDLTAIVTELGIDVTDDSGSGTTITPVMRELMSLDSRKSTSVESLLPNAQFSSEGDLSSPAKEDCGQLPIGQLPLEALGVKETTAAAKTVSTPPPAKETTEVDRNLKLNEIIINLSKDKSITVAQKSTDEVPIMKTAIHRMPPTVAPTKFSVKNVYPAKAVLKKPEVGSEVKKSFLFQRLSSGEKGESDEKTAQVLVGTSSPVTAGVIIKDPVTGKTTTVSRIINIRSPPPGKLSEGVSDPVISNVASWSESEDTPLKISEVKSLSQEDKAEKSNKIVINIQSKDTEAPQIQPPIIRVEDFQAEKPSQSSNKESEEPKRAESPEIICLDDDDEEPARRKEPVESDEEKESGKRTRSGRSLLKKLKIEKETPSDDKIRQEMERLRNQMENETDCWLFDDDSSQKSSGDKNDEDVGALLSPIEEAIFSLNKKLESEIQKDDVSSDANKDADEPSDDKECNESSEKVVDNEDDVSLDSSTDKSESRRTRDKGVDMKNARGSDIALFGTDLYICGVGTCSFSAETDKELLTHLHVCDYSRESTIITCPHCSKRIKQVGPYVEHLKLHGERRYSCGLCDFAGGIEISVSRHMKLKHKVNLHKTVPKEPVEKGYFVLYPKNHKQNQKTETPKDLKMTGYSPGDEDKLPLQAVYLENVKCAMCPYMTKVRSNMVRHLKIHAKSAETEGVVVVPTTAPTNPVPCLDTKEKMFDKMTNLAASSQLAQAKEKTAIDTLTPEEEARLPIYVPEQMRYKCCSPDCTYLTIDDSMLRHHIKALHDEITYYSCPHCTDAIPLDFRLVALDKLGNHLKYHDSKLYKCAHCSYFQHQKHVVEKHVLEKHPEKRYYVHTVREPKIESASEEEFLIPDATAKAWKCGFCNDFESTVRTAVQDHVYKVHNSKSKYKCKLCDMKSSQVHAFTAHFTSKHKGETVDYVKAILKINATPEAATTSRAAEPPKEHFDTTPLWLRDAPRVRHIRGILIEEEEVKTKKTKKKENDEEDKDSNSSTPPLTFDCYYCPLCADQNKTFKTKNADSFKSHLYQELNYNPIACILCGKMFVDMKEFEKHHVKSHPDKPESYNQTKEDEDITFWVEKVINKQKKNMDQKRRTSVDEKQQTTPKKKKIQSPEKPRSALKKNLLTRSTSSSSESEPNRDYEKDFTCRHCQIKLNDLNALKAHIKVTHLKLGRFLCTFCESTFQTDSLAQKHCRNEHPSDSAKFIPNPEIGKTELNEEFWKNQYGFENGKIMKNFVPKNVIRCRFCNFRDIPQLVRSHEKSHLEATQFKCGHCDFKAKEREMMQNHIKNSHPGAKCLFSEEPIASIGATPSSSKKSNTESKSNIVYSCKICAMESNFEKEVIKHMETEHRTSPDLGEIRKDEGEKILYCCNNCIFKAPDVETLTKHGSEQHGQSAVGHKKIKLIEYDLIDDIELCVACHKTDCVCGTAYTADTAPDGYYNCPECEYICRTYEECIAHFKNHYRRFGCKVCVAKFVTEAEFKEHHKLTKHPANYKILEAEKGELEENKAIILMKKNGKWTTVGKKRGKGYHSADTPSAKKFKS